MGRITSIQRKDLSRNTIHGKVPATYCVCDIEGTKYFQIHTYGSPYKKGSAKQSTQNIQFDCEFAKELIAILRQEFKI